MPSLETLLTEKKEEILNHWFDLVMATYAPETARLWTGNRNRFSNPVGARFKAGMTGVLDNLANCPGTPDTATFEPHLDEIVRVRAIQDFSPSQASAFIFLLKKALREALWGEATKNGLFVELLALESRVDVLALITLDIYCKCREKLFEIRINQIKNQYDRLLKRANLVCDFSLESQGVAEDDSRT